MKKRRTAVTYTLNSCVKCMRCVQGCPVSALKMQDGRVEVNAETCINCGLCIKVCHSQGIMAKGSTLADLENYDYRVALIPSAMMSRCETLQDAGKMMYAIKMLGFDEVIDLSPIEGQILHETKKMAYENGQMMISNHCPVINDLIAQRYPMLLDSLTPFKHTEEIAAEQVRKKHSEKENVGIFYFSECEAKLLHAKYPYGDPDTEIDHALSAVDILPQIREHMDDGEMTARFCREGLLAGNPMMIHQTKNDLIADGVDKVNDILDMAEFGLLKSFKILYLSSCYGGCVGGHLLWGNCYRVKNNYETLTETTKRHRSELPIEELTLEHPATENVDPRSMKEKLNYFRKVNEQLEKLPGYDCSACGLQTCRIMAEEIVKGNKSLDDCNILNNRKENR